MAEGAALEKRYTVTRYRGFESRPLRHEIIWPLVCAVTRGHFGEGAVQRSIRGGAFSQSAGSIAGAYAERCQSGRMGAPGKRVSRLRGTVGSNPTLSATRLFISILGY